MWIWDNHFTDTTYFYHQCVSIHTFGMIIFGAGVSCRECGQHARRGVRRRGRAGARPGGLLEGDPTSRRADVRRERPSPPPQRAGHRGALRARERPVRTRRPAQRRRLREDGHRQNILGARLHHHLSGSTRISAARTSRLRPQYIYLLNKKRIFILNFNLYQCEWSSVWDTECVVLCFSLQ